MTATLRATFVPFAAMTPADQAAHLVHAHGMNADYFAGLPGITSDADVLAAWLTPTYDETNSGGGSYPLPSERTAWHDNDHASGDADEVLACQHTHDKPAEWRVDHSPTFDGDPYPWHYTWTGEGCPAGGHYGSRETEDLAWESVAAEHEAEA